MEQLTKNQAVATSQEAVQNQNEPQRRDENAHHDKSVHGLLNPTYQAGLRRALSLHDALPIFSPGGPVHPQRDGPGRSVGARLLHRRDRLGRRRRDRKSTRLNSSHVKTSYAVFCLKKKKLFRIRMSRNIGMKMLTMTNMST